jgi:hypothetical protein
LNQKCGTSLNTSLCRARPSDCSSQLGSTTTKTKKSFEKITQDENAANNKCMNIYMKTYKIIF